MKIALITGATSGIGEALAHEFAKNNIWLFLVSRDSQKLERVAKDLNKGDLPVHTFAVDLSKTDAALQVHNFTKVNNLEIDYLVNNAGFGDFGAFHSMDEQKMADMIELNVGTLTKLTRLFLPDMIERGDGKILNLASTASFQPGPLMAVYFATKAYVLNFSLAIAKELENTGITVTALCPGPTESSFSDTASVGESKIFSGRLPTSAEVATFGFQAMAKEEKIAIHGRMNKIKAFFVKFLPTDIMLREIEKSMKRA